jgi:hypothetical protein
VGLSPYPTGSFNGVETRGQRAAAVRERAATTPKKLLFVAMRRMIDAAVITKNPPNRLTNQSRKNRKG